MGIGFVLYRIELNWLPEADKPTFAAIVWEVTIRSGVKGGTPYAELILSCDLPA